MGSNRRQQPSQADQGNSVWSRDERRWNRSKGRGNRDRDAIDDSIDSNYEESGCGPDCKCQGHDPMEPFVDRKPPRKKRRASKKWCRRKEGREHVYGEPEQRGFPGWRYTIRRCTVCGHKDYDFPRR